MSRRAISPFIESLPKAELHLHLEGTVDAATLSELSRKNATPFPWANNRYKPLPDSNKVLSVEEAERLYEYKDFTGFLMAFKAVTERMRDGRDYELVTYRMMEKLARQNVKHAEVFVSVGVIFWRGQDFEELFEGMERGRLRGERDFGMSLYWIFDAVRHFGPEEGEKVLAKALELRNDAVIGIGIGGDERQAGPEPFEHLYARAARHGLRLSVHAGETVGPQSIWGALDKLKAERLGHALHAWPDAKLMERLVREQIPLEICISSNVRTACCHDLAAHPVRRYFDEGALVTLNTDDPEMFQTSLVEEYQIAQEVFGFSDAELKKLAENSFRASWLPEKRKQELMESLK